MRFWEKLSANICRLIPISRLVAFKDRSPELMLRKSFKMLDTTALGELKTYVRSRMHPTGGFMDRAGNPDLYYSLFGYFISVALDLNNELAETGRYVENEIRNKMPQGVYLHCAAILASGLSDDRKLRKTLRVGIRKEIENRTIRQSGYGAFVSLMSCYYIRYYRGLFQIKKQLDNIVYDRSLPSTVIAALQVLQAIFEPHVKVPENILMDFYDKRGGFKAVRTAPVSDLLSTAVVLYALCFTGYDMRMIKPECLSFIDSLYFEGGFAGNILDPDPDIEYTFYGLLALGSLSD
jgi:hypothetical protein